MASSDALQKIKAARRWKAEFYKTIPREYGGPCDMYYLDYGGDWRKDQDISIAIDHGPVPTAEIAQLIADRLNKEDK